MKKIKYILLVLVILFVIVLGIRFVFGGPEDSWICNNGNWIKHGNPSSAMPTDKCLENGDVENIDCKYCDFIHEGNFIHDGDIDYLVFELPGKPALKVMLNFDNFAGETVFLGEDNSEIARDTFLNMYIKTGDRVLVKGRYSVPDGGIYELVFVKIIKSISNKILID